MDAAITQLLRGSGLKSRRIGQRVTAPGLWLDWQPASPQGGRTRRRRAQMVQRAQVMDLSITGAQVVVDEAPIGVGTSVTIGLDGGTGTCRIRRAESAGPGQTAYGIRFDRLDPELAQTIHDLVARNRPSAHEQEAPKG